MAFRMTSFALVAAVSTACSIHPGSSDAGPSPAHDSWTTKGPEPLARFEAFAANDGTRIWFLGGISVTAGNVAPSVRVDWYDAASDSWTDGPDLPADGPKHHLSLAVLDGRIYVLGGFDGILGSNTPFTPVARAYVFDGSAWRSLANPPLARGAATAQAIGGKIYVTGGAPTEDVPPYGELDIYDPATDSWTTGTPLPTAREHLASCAIGGKFIVVGGWIGPANHASHAAERYDPATDTWTPLPDLPTARGGLEAIDLNGSCHVIGGEDWDLPFPGTLHAHEAYDPSAGAWSTFAPMPTARHGFGLAQEDGALYAIGGGPTQGNSYTDVVEMYSP
jgi:N-acetylneuraminic acid mutarotase